MDVPEAVARLSELSEKPFSRETAATMATLMVDGRDHGDAAVTDQEVAALHRAVEQALCDEFLPAAQPAEH